MLRTHTGGELRLDACGQRVRDRYGLTQLVFNMETNAELCNMARTLGREYVLQVEGVVSERSNKNKNIPTGDIEI